jgi:hypothetical protein
MYISQSRWKGQAIQHLPTLTDCLQRTSTLSVSALLRFAASAPPLYPLYAAEPTLLSTSNAVSTTINLFSGVSFELRDPQMLTLAPLYSTRVDPQGSLNSRRGSTSLGYFWSINEIILDQVPFYHSPSSSVNSSSSLELDAS